MNESIAPSAPTSGDDIFSVLRFLNEVSAEFQRALISEPVRQAIVEFQAATKAATKVISDHQEEIRAAFEKFRSLPAWTPADSYH